MKISKIKFLYIAIAIAILSTICIFLQYLTQFYEKIIAVKSLTLERTSCLGNCPAYSLRIDANGDVTFIGKADVSRLGALKSTISKAAFEELNQELLRFNFASINFPKLPEALTLALVQDEMTRVCPTYLTDHPSMSISVSRLIGEKKIKHYLGCRGLDIYPNFKKLGKRIDELTKSDEWIYPRSGG